MNWYETFETALKKKTDKLVFDGKDFLLDPLEDTKLTINIQQDNDKICIGGQFTYTFSEEFSAYILRKRCILNRTFSDIGMDAFADADIGVESIEEGVFALVLREREFTITQDDYSAVITFLLRFVEFVIAVQNAESCRC